MRGGVSCSHSLVSFCPCGSASFQGKLGLAFGGASKIEAKFSMKIGFDVSQTGAGKAGCGFYAEAMIDALCNLSPHDQFVLYPSMGDFFWDSSSWGRAVTKSNVTLGPRQKTIEEAALFWRAEDLENRLGNIDILHANAFWCPDRLKRIKLVYTLYDLSFLEEPAWTTEANRIGCFRGVFNAVKHADWIVAISSASREHFLRVFPSFPPERIDVVYPCSRYREFGGSTRRPRRRRLGSIEPGRFWLSVGTIEPRKNQERLLKAYGEYLDAGGPLMPLVLVGPKGWLMDHFPDTLKGMNLRKHIILAGYVSDAELAWLYENCCANIYTSLFEGFGLPVLEGMQFGAPTIGSNVTSIPEICGDAAILVNPLDPNELAVAMLTMARDAPRRLLMRQLSIDQASKFSWQASAEKLIDVYRRAIDSPKRSRIDRGSALTESSGSRAATTYRNLRS